MKQLVFVHGRSQEGKDPEQLKWTWVEAWKKGLEKSGLALPLQYEDIAFPFYGDILDELAYGDDTQATVITRGAGLNQEELRFKIAIMDAMRSQVGLTDERVLEASGNPAIQKGLLNKEWAQAILRGFDKHVPGLSGLTVDLFTHDVFSYLKRPGVRRAVDDVVRNEMKEGAEYVVVGHSLGTIVTYSVLGQDEVLIAPLHLTLGSPLGIRVIQDALYPIRRPKSVRNWYNALDQRDPVALYPLEPPAFSVQPPVVNKKDVDNFTKNRHGIVGYLSDRDVAKTLWEAIAE